MSNFHRISKHIARKFHKCDLCKHIIARGDQYTRIQGVLDGNFGTMKLCKDCTAKSAYASSVKETVTE